MKKTTAVAAWAAFACALAVAPTGCELRSALDDRVLSESKDFGFRGDRLTVKTDKDVTLRPADGPTVTADRELVAQAAEDGNAAWTLKDSTLELSAECSGFVPKCKAEYTVHVPAGMAVTVHGTDSAEVTAKGIDGELDLKTDQAAGVVIEGASAPIKVRTDSGAVRATGLSSTDVDVATGDGGTGLHFDKAPENVRAESATGGITVRVPADGTRYRVSAATGPTTPHVDVPKDPRATRTITAKSDVGAVRIGTKG